MFLIQILAIYKKEIIAMKNITQKERVNQIGYIAQNTANNKTTKNSIIIV